MEKFEVEGNKVFIDWYPKDVKLYEIDNWINKIREELDPEEEIFVDISMCGPNSKGGSLIDMGSTEEELKKIIPPLPDKPYRIRLANHLNFIMDLYNTLT